MVNPIFRRRLISSVANAVRHAHDAAQSNHLGVRGRLREVALQELVKPLLPNGIQAGTGVVVDSDGRQSSQIDIIIYSTSLLPPFMKVEEQVFVPVEACIQAIEVKSRLTIEEIRDATTKAASIKNLNVLMNAAAPFRVSPMFSLFAFGSDLIGNVKTELDRYLEYKSDPEGFSYVLLNDMCVVGKGYWKVDITPTGWSFVGPTDEYEEVLSMLVDVANSIPHWMSYRGVPQFGSYIKIP